MSIRKTPGESTRQQRLQRWFIILLSLIALATAALALLTWHSLMPLPPTLAAGQSFTPSGAHTEQQSATPAYRARIVASDHSPLAISYQNPLNHSQLVPLESIPLLLRQAFITAEDRRYWTHAGIDWQARAAALLGNIMAGKTLRGASSIAEQSARIVKPRPRTYWGHWMAGWDGLRLVHRFGHAEVLTFYLNQVPYAAERRGVVQAAHYYFGREPGNLNPAEQLALAIIVRSPTAYDPRRQPSHLRRAVSHLATRMLNLGYIGQTELETIQVSVIKPGNRAGPVLASAWLRHVRNQAARYQPGAAVIRSTLLPDLQAFARQLLSKRLRDLAPRGIRNGAVLVADNHNGHILAWVAEPGEDVFGIDPVITRRQPGSTLKPFVYARAMQKFNWQADHILDDSPFGERLENGTHRYSNYSQRHYGAVSLRYALGNSLNIPVIKTALAVGVDDLLQLLQHLGFSSFTQSANYYGGGIALGDGAVSLYELVQAYSALARKGSYLPLQALADVIPPDPTEVIPSPIASVITSILADPDARAAEFGTDSVLNLPMATAIKTGTSSNYRDAWTIAYDNRYTVGVWMGRLDGGFSDEVTGSIGPAVLVRQLFGWLRAEQPYAGLWRSPQLQAVNSCHQFGASPCLSRSEWYWPSGSSDTATAQTLAAHAAYKASISHPVPDTRLALDPRVPRKSQQLQLSLRLNRGEIEQVQWYINNKLVRTTQTPPKSPAQTSAAASALWPLQPGQHTLHAEVRPLGHPDFIRTQTIAFEVQGMSETE